MFGNTTKKEKDPEARKYSRRLKRRKRLLRLILSASFILSMILSFDVLMNRFGDMIQPQINRAIVQVAKLLPQL